jgi:AmmeMemoRadiSam system protein B
MNKKVLLFAAIAVLAGLILIKSELPKHKQEAYVGPAHSNYFFEEEVFNESVSRNEKNNSQFDYHITGGIIPHHLYPSFIIADFFKRLTEQNPKTLILIGPNHLERGNHEVLSSLYGWETPFGIVSPNIEIIQNLQANKLIQIDEKNMPEEHSVAGIMPFIKYYLPETKVVPLILSGYMNEENTMTLANNLIKFIDNETVIIAAVDFSHYLTNNEAKEKDKITLNLIKQFYYGKLFTLNNDYLDSAPSVAVLLMMMQKNNTERMELLHHTNSGELQKNNSIETTSYFSIAFY